MGRTYIHTNTYTHTYIRGDSCMPDTETYIHACLPTYIHIHIHIYTYTYINAHLTHVSLQIYIISEFIISKLLTFHASIFQDFQNFHTILFLFVMYYLLFIIASSI